jgi:hypothetical protein
VTLALSDTPAAGTGSDVNFLAFGPPRLSANGQVAHFATLAGKGVTTHNDSGIWRDGALLAREGSAAIGAGKDIVFGDFSNMVMGANGHVVFKAGLVDATTTSAIGFGIWRDNTLVARTGAAAPGTGAGVQFADLVSHRVNGAGQVAYYAQLAGDGVSGTNNTGLWVDNTLVVRAGQAAPAMPSGTVFSAVANTYDFNAKGQVAFLATVSGGGTTSSNDTGIWRDGALVAREGSAVPGTTGGVAFSGFNGIQLNGNGQVLYSAFLNGTDITSANNFGFWLDNRLVARTGDAAPGLGGGVVIRTLDAPARLNAAGQVAYMGTLSGAGVSASNDRAIWRDGLLMARTGGGGGAASGGFHFASFVSASQLINAGGQVAFQGKLAGGADGLFMTDGKETLQAVGPGDVLAGSTATDLSISTLSFNDKAQLAYTATLADGRSGIFLFTPALRWRSTTGGSWADAANWTLSLNPADVHDVTLDPGNSLTITGPSNTVAVKSLQVGTGTGVATLAMAGGRIDAESVRIGAQGVLSGTGSFGSLVTNQGVLQAERLQLLGGLDNQGTVRGAAGLGSRLDTNLNNTSSGRVRVGSGETLQLFGKEHQNAGVVEVNGGRLETSGSFTNAKAGLVDLKNATVVADSKWRNEAGARLLLNEARLTTAEGFHNAGQVQVTSGSSEVLGAVLNEAGGQIILSGAGTTTFYDNVEAQNGSELRVSGGATAVFFGAVQQRSGAVFSGSGLKYYEGGFSVGNSPGAASDAGDVSFGLGNTYLAELGGTVAGTGFDHYSVAGTLTLNGGLILTSWDGFTGQAGQSFDLFDWGQLQGQFASVDSSGLLLAEGTRLDLSRLYVDGTVSVTAVPEPATWALWISGLLAGALKLRRGRHAAVGV